MKTIKFPHTDSVVTEEIDFHDMGILNVTMEVCRYITTDGGLHEDDKYLVAEVKQLKVLNVDGKEDKVLIAQVYVLINAMLTIGAIGAEIEERLG